MGLPQMVLPIEFGRNPMFSPSLVCETVRDMVQQSLLVSPATMTSADFSTCNPYRSRSPRVRTYSFPQYPLDLPDRYLVVSHPLDVSMLCYLVRPARPQYPVPVRWNRGLQSRFLQCMPHGKPPCGLLTLRDSLSRESGLPPHVRGLHPLEYYGIFDTMPMPGTHSTFAIGGVSYFAESFVIKSSSVL